ncbi:MAG TPA: histidine kinase dimerization/phospho-acceptor domain-containing protein, partial [Alkalispirochaeta sp.]|nr:histidine kinase dimerization/phospho-acceptor domain-containing protein [Alkalispirochaeta sp.]
MARTLIRLVFPQFAVRMILIVVAMAVVIFLVARSYRIEMILEYSTSQANVLQASFAHTEPKTHGEAVQWIRMVVSDTGPGVILFTSDGEAILRHNVEISPASTSQLATAALRRHSQITLRDTDALVIGAVVPLAIDQTEGQDTSAYLAVLNDGRELQQELAALALWLSLMVGIILLAVLLISYRVVRNIQSPLRHLQTTAASFAEGNLQSRSVLAEPIEFYRLGEAMNSMAAQLSTRIDAIRNQRQQLEAILEAMVEGVLLVDGYHRITSMNPAARRLFHTSELTNRRGEYRTLLEVIRNSELFDLVRSTFEKASQQERRIVIYSNPPRHMQVHGTSLEIGGAPHVLVVLNDITRLHELEQIRTEFVANVSHELKTPITSILGFVETLSEGALEETDQAHRFLDIIA